MGSGGGAPPPFEAEQRFDHQFLIDAAQVRHQFDAFLMAIDVTLWIYYELKPLME